MTGRKDLDELKIFVYLKNNFCNQSNFKNYKQKLETILLIEI